MMSLVTDSANDHASRNWMAQLLEALRPRVLLPALSATASVGVMLVCVNMSLAGLIFSGPLAGHLPQGIGVMFLGCAIMVLTVGLTNSLPGTITPPQDAPTIILAVAAAATTANLPTATAPAHGLGTLMAVIVLSTMLTAMVFLILGGLKLTNLLRFIPHPVIGGFLAATGWMLAVGALGLVTNLSPNLANLSAFFHGSAMAKWVLALLWAVGLLLATKRWRHYLVMPGAVILSVALFYLIVGITQTPLARLAADGWLIAPSQESRIWPPYTVLDMGLVNWSVVFAQTGQVFMVALISSISLLLNVRGLEIVTDREIDMNREMISSGLANLLAGFFGCPVGYPSLGVTSLTYRVGATTRLTPVLVALFFVMVTLFGSGFISFFPTFLLGAMLFFLGLSFLTEWLYQGWFTLPRMDYVMVLGIVVTTGFFGFLTGVAVGLTVTVTMFVFNYSRTDPVKSIFNRTGVQSTVRRPPAHSLYLESVGARILIMRLQGYIFFGSAYNLLDQTRREAAPSQTVTRRVVILDFSLVTGFDSSATHLLVKIANLFQSRGAILVFTQVSSRIHSLMKKSGLLGSEHVKTFVDLDHGLEWAEDLLVADMSRDRSGLTAGLKDAMYDRTMKQLDVIEMFEKWLEIAGGVMESRQLAPGTFLCHQEHAADGVYFLAGGQAVALLERQDGTILRLGLINPLTVFGETALYADQPASFTVQTVTECRVYHLELEKLATLENEHPGIEGALHRMIAFFLEERLAHFTQILKTETATV